MRPTIWFKNKAGDIWNLRPDKITDTFNCSFFYALDGTGFESKLAFARIKNDFVVTEEQPQQVPITGTMYFRNPEHLKRFSEFVGDYTQELQFFYDPTGRIDPRSQIDRPWYKWVRINKMTSGEQDAKTGYWLCKITCTPLSAMWRRDTTIASTVSQVIGDPHVYQFVYPYFYQSERKLYLDILNEGERIGCRVEIKNIKTGESLKTLEWVCSSGKSRQYAKWLEGIGLAPGRTLVIDSTQSDQEATVQYGDNTDDVQDHQEPSPQYINFVELLPGNNQIVFNLGTIEGVEVKVSYTEQVRVL